MATLVQAPQASPPATAASAGPGLFGTGCWFPVEALVSADPVVAVRPPRAPAAPPPAPPRRRAPGRRPALWGAGPDGAHLAWRAAPLRVHRLGAGPAPAARTAAPAARPAPTAAAVPPPPPPPRHAGPAAPGAVAPHLPLP